MSCGGALTHFSCKLGLKKFFPPPWGGGAGAPTAPPWLRLCCIHLNAGQVDLTQADESFDIAKPLTVALRELGPCTGPVLKLLIEAGADAGVDDYTGLSISLSAN